MRLVVLGAPGRLETLEVEEPQPGPGEVRVRVACVGICGSDLEVFHGRRAPRLVGGRAVVGHETSGIVDRLGEGVCGLRAGDRVATNGTWGTLTGYVVVRPENVLRFSRRIALRDGCLLEVLPGVMMASTRSGIDRSSRVLVAGQGLSGLLLTRTIALHGCRALTVVDPHPGKLALARELGATETVRGTLAEARAALRSRFEEDTDGFDVCVIATPDAARIDEAAELVRTRGRIVFYGGLEEAARIDLLALHHRSVTLIKEGERINGVLEARALWREALQLVLDGALPLRRLRTHLFPFAEAQRAFELRSDPASGAIHVVLENEWAAGEDAEPR